MSALHPEPDSGQTSRAPRQTKQTMTPYFAYGSNLQLAQMAQRCPASIFSGRATLPGYRWQINQRGVANVVPCDEPGCKVEGLIYLINSKDEKSLDRSEGVARDFYQKHLLRMSFEPHERFAYYKTSGLAAALSGRGGVAEYDGVGSMGPGGGFSDVMGAEPATTGSPGFIKALVYMSKNYAEDGEIRSEYIGRMQKAITDALRLGVNQSFIDDFIRPHLGSAVSPDMPGLPPRKRKVESKRKSGTLTAPDSASRSKHADMMEMDTDQGSKPYILVREVSPRPGKRVDVKALLHENRERHHESRLAYPAEMLNLLLDAHAGDGRDDETVFAVCCKERDMRSDQPRFSIPATTMDLELANEFAMKHFRQACSRIPEMAFGAWNRSDVEPCPRGALIWSLDKNGCLRLCITSHDGLDERTVWVNAQILLKR